jgi:NADH-quinone oxidoreductase subunit J
MTVALFLMFAALLVGTSLMVILHRNPVTSALFLVLAFCSLAVLYLLLQAPFLAMVQVLVYAGAIMVLFLFVLMYLNLKRDVEDGFQHALRRVVGWGAGVVVLVLGTMLFARRWAVGPLGTDAPERVHAAGNTESLGQLLYSQYLFPFELTSLVLLVAMVGAVVIGKGRKRRPGEDEGA